MYNILIFDMKNTCIKDISPKKCLRTELGNCYYFFNI